jgi:hypothetical protein
MKNWIRRWLGIDRDGYENLPDPLEDDNKILTKIAVVNCEGGGKVVTTERRFNGTWEHKVYIVPDGKSVLETMAVILVEARL